MQFTVWTREVIAAMSESKCVLSAARAFGSSDRPPPVVEDDEPLPPPTDCAGEMPSEFCVWRRNWRSAGEMFWRKCGGGWSEWDEEEDGEEVGGCGR